MLDTASFRHFVLCADGRRHLQPSEEDAARQGNEKCTPGWLAYTLMRKEAMIEIWRCAARSLRYRADTGPRNTSPAHDTMPRRFMAWRTAD